MRRSQVRAGRSRCASASAQSPGEAKISKRVREGNVTVRSTSSGTDGNEGAIGEAQ